MALSEWRSDWNCLSRRGTAACQPVKKTLPESSLKIGSGAGEVIVIQRAGVRFYRMYLMIGPGLGAVGAAGTTSLSFLSVFVPRK